MPALVVYDSQYGNTEKLAHAIAEAIGATVKRASDSTTSDLNGIDLLVVGSPTQGGNALVPAQQFLASIPDGALRNVRVAAFDTRIDPATSSFFLRMLMKLISFAAPRIDAALKKKGGTQAAPPEGFIVTGKEGPLKDGELERARAWATGLR